MFKIIGSDRKEYGPVPVEELRRWVAERRVNGQTVAQRAEGGEWRPLSAFTEFADLATPSLAHTAPEAARAAGQRTTDSARVVASSLVQGPAIFMIVLGALDVLTGLAGMAFTLFGAALPMLNTPDRPLFGTGPNWMIAFQLPSQIAGVVISIVCVIGAVRMMQLRNHGLALLCAVLTMLPCGACCCLLNLGCGVWALTVLTKPEVKEAFE